MPALLTLTEGMSNHGTGPGGNGQRGFVGAKFYFTCKLLNEGWMAVVEAGVDDLA